MNKVDPPLRELVLLGGGHAHVQVVRRFGMRKETGIRLTLISREGASPYTGMLPGFVAGEYSAEEIAIDLHRLTRFPQCRFIEANVVRVDLANQSLVFSGNRAPLRFDCLSINIGGDCTMAIPGGEYVEPLKPIGRFLQRWPETFQKILDSPQSTVAIIGGGPGSVEFALALRQRIGDSFRILLLSRASQLLPTHGRYVRKLLIQELSKNRIDVQIGFDVREIQPTDRAGRLRLVSASGAAVVAASIFSATGVEASSWLKDSKFATDDAGFLSVNRFLQSESSENVFGAGDAVSLMGQNRPKSGVYSVREGPILATNLRRFLLGQSLKPFRAQRKSLALIRTGPESAVASRGLIQSSGKTLWRYKDWIDRRFMRRFKDLPVMPQESVEYRGSLSAQAPAMTMRCGGCGAKLGADILQRTLHRLEIHEPEFIEAGVGEDAALMNLGSNTVAISCDSFRAMIDDPWRFGRIAAHHALNDLYAVNSSPNIAVALVSVPLMADHLMEEELYQLLSGALTVFNDENVALVGGHSAEGAELTLGFTVVGETYFHAMRKSQLEPSQALVLTKPLGTGAILAGAMDGRCSVSALSHAVEVMDHSNAVARSVFSDYDVTACTDITGFGLAGHLGEMLRASGLSATLDVKFVPCLTEALSALSNGIESSLQSNNEQILEDCQYKCSSRDPRLRILADPQTSGGLLGSIDMNYAERCVEELRRYGYADASVIGYTDSAISKVGQMTIRT